MNKKFALFLVLALILLSAASYWYFSQVATLKHVVNTSWSSIELSRKLKEELGLTNSYVEEADSVRVTAGYWEVLFSKSKDQNSQIRALQEVTTRLRMDSSHRKLVDLRFNKVVIRDI